MEAFTPRSAADQYLLDTYGADVSAHLAPRTIPEYGGDVTLWAAITCQELAYTIVRRQGRVSYLAESLVRYAEHPLMYVSHISRASIDIERCEAEIDACKRLLDILVCAFKSREEK